MPPTPAPVKHAPPLLWAAARALIVTIFNLFGEPAHIAWQHTHRKSERTLLLKWLRAGEALMRHLLLIEAAAHARPNTRPLLNANTLLKPKRVRRLMTFEADQPEAWRVSFRCFMERRRPAGVLASDRAVRRRGRRRSIQFYSAWPLAERAEAMLRAFNTPEPYARRLARRLYATPHRAACLTRHPENLPHVMSEPDFALLRAEAAGSRRRFDSG